MASSRALIPDGTTPAHDHRAHSHQHQHQHQNHCNNHLEAAADHNSSHSRELLHRHFQSIDLKQSSIEAKVAMSYLQMMRPNHSQYSSEPWAEAPSQHSYYEEGHSEGGSPYSGNAMSEGSYSGEPQEGMDISMARDCHICHCGKAFRRPSDLTKHQKYHIKFFSCLAPGCERAFSTQKDLSRHIRTHAKGEGWRCSVQGCRKATLGHVYGRKDNFERHMRTAHPTLYEGSS